MDAWHITVNELEHLRKVGYMLYIVDIRETEQYCEYHIKDAVNMCVQDEEEGIMSEDSENLIRSRISEGYLVVLYCEHGNTGMKCVRNMRKHFIVAYNLYGGIEEYRSVMEK